MTSVSHTGADGIIVKCEGCDKNYRIHPEKIPAGVTSFPCRACATLIPLAQIGAEETSGEPAGVVLVVVEEEELGRLIQRILGQNGYKGHLATTGKQALEALEEGSLDLILTSVYLPDMMGYELLDKITDGESGTRIPSILLSAIHHAARYKRAPTSLYGADDYLERHHLPDLLIPKIGRLLASPEDRPPQVTPHDLPPPSDEQVTARRDLEAVETSEHPDEDPKMGEIQRMCRVIVGDIALYNQDVIASVPPDGLLDALASDLSEGEALLMHRFPEMEEQLPYLLRGEMIRLLSSRGLQVAESADG